MRAEPGTRGRKLDVDDVTQLSLRVVRDAYFDDPVPVVRTYSCSSVYLRSSGMLATIAPLGFSPARYATVLEKLPGAAGCAGKISACVRGIESGDAVAAEGLP